MRKINPVYRPYWDAEGRYRILYGGAGSSKSVTAAQKHIALAGQNENVRVLTLRKVGRTCRRSTFQLYQDVLAGMNRLGEVQINKTEMRIGFPGGGEILHSGLDDTEKLKSVHGVTHIWIEEATELDFPHSPNQEPDLAQIDLRLRGVDPGLKPSITLTFNPTQYAQDIFEYVGISEDQLPRRDHRAFEDGEVYVQHTTHEDNPFVGEDYMAAFRRLGGSMQQIYEKGEMARVDDPDQVIPYSLIKQARDLEPEEGTGYMAVDVARFGDDKTILAHKRGNETYKLDRYEGLSIDRVATVATTAARERGLSAEHVGVDAVGMGAGVVDNMSADGMDVQEIVSGGGSCEYKDRRETAYQFYNLRSQMWWTMRENMRQGRCALTADSKELAEDLCAPRYQLQSEKTIRVEKKKSVKERIGRSPDEGDAAVYVEAVKDLALDPTPEAFVAFGKAGEEWWDGVE